MTIFRRCKCLCYSIVILAAFLCAGCSSSADLPLAAAPVAVGMLQYNHTTGTVSGTITNKTNQIIRRVDIQLGQNQGWVSQLVEVPKLKPHETRRFVERLPGHYHYPSPLKVEVSRIYVDTITRLDAYER